MLGHVSPPLAAPPTGCAPTRRSATGPREGAGSRLVEDVLEVRDVAVEDADLFAPLKVKDRRVASARPRVDVRRDEHLVGGAKDRAVHGCSVEAQLSAVSVRPLHVAEFQVVIEVRILPARVPPSPSSRLAGRPTGYPGLRARSEHRRAWSTGVRRSRGPRTDKETRSRAGRPCSCALPTSRRHSSGGTEARVERTVTISLVDVPSRGAVTRFSGEDRLRRRHLAGQ
jgi:hypothetical protein